MSWEGKLIYHFGSTQISIGGSEVAVFEFKPENVNAATCAEGQGLVLEFYELRRYEDVIGTGKTSRAWLPYDELSLKRMVAVGFRPCSFSVH
ncbi:hypothetical protein BGZ49_008723, partial [Haplosporangium sp. Z 27]